MISFIQIQAKQSEAIRPVQTAVKLKCTYSYSLHHAASRSSTPPGQAVGYKRKRVSSFIDFWIQVSILKKIEFNITTCKDNS